MVIAIFLTMPDAWVTMFHLNNSDRLSPQYDGYGNGFGGLLHRLMEHSALEASQPFIWSQ